MTFDALAEDLRRLLRGRVAVVGVGHELLGDDAVGLVIARTLSEDLPPEVVVFDCGEVPENYLGDIRESGAQTVLFCDAADFGGQPGEVRLLDPTTLTWTSVSTHRLPLRLSGLYLAEVESISLLAVQPLSTALGQGLSPVVAESATRVAELLRQVLESRNPE